MSKIARFLSWLVGAQDRDYNRRHDDTTASRSRDRAEQAKAAREAREARDRKRREGAKKNR